MISQDDLRAQFSRAMSDMYGREVPLYAELKAVVAEVNRQVLQDHPELDYEMGGLSRVSEERHGAIRLGTLDEFKTIARLFRQMGMFPVGYYDLTIVNLPIHSTAFRPVSPQSLAKNPFRIFTSVLRLDLAESQIRQVASDLAGDVPLVLEKLESIQKTFPKLFLKKEDVNGLAQHIAQLLLDADDLVAQVRSILTGRKIFTDRLLDILATAELQKGMTAVQSEEFMSEALETFKWRSHAAVSKTMYVTLLLVNSLVADIVGFKGPHINHLTPRVLDIDALHQKMTDMGHKMIAQIQGPPRRAAPILLRQTSFRALEETIRFTDKDGAHKARFGEIEFRGVALTPKGRALYDRLLAEVMAQVSEDSPNYAEVLNRVFSVFPDHYDALRREGLAYFRYEWVGQAQSGKIADDDAHSLETWISQGRVRAIPMTYEDFLPVSAAGIFRSNLIGNDNVTTTGAVAQETLLSQASQEAIGMPIADPFALYACK
jgi:uncharacterized glyoxalase superfamily metalloenzyme YdcJ